MTAAEQVEIPVLEGQISIDDVLGEWADCESCGHAESDHVEEACDFPGRWCQCAGYWGLRAGS